MTTALSTTYVCRHCFQVLPFWRFWRKPDGTWSKCKQCLIDTGYKHKKPPATRNRNRLRHRQRVKAILKQIKRQGRCSICRAKKNLTFHHLRPKQKRFNLFETKSRGYTHLREELAKCCLLCQPCHRRLHQHDWHIRHIYHLQPIRLDDYHLDVSLDSTSVFPATIPA